MECKLTGVTGRCWRRAAARLVWTVLPLAWAAAGAQQPAPVATQQPLPPAAAAGAPAVTVPVPVPSIPAPVTPPVVSPAVAAPPAAPSAASASAASASAAASAAPAFAPAALAASAATTPPPETPAVAARFADPPVPYETPGLQPGRSTFTSNAELADALQALAALPGGPQWLDAGRSVAGDALPALHFSHGPGRPVVLLVGQQHGDEPAGAEALLVLAQQLAAGALDDVLANVDVLLLPRANPDGAARGQRRNLQGLDINRDHLLLRTPEAQAIARLVAAHQPLLLVDAHEHSVAGHFQDKFGAVQRHDLLLQLATTPNLPAPLVLAGDTLLRRPLLQALADAGLRADWYHMPAAGSLDLRLAMGGLQPDTARNLQGLRNGFGVLLESRGVGLGRLHIQRRVHSHVVALHSLLRSAAAQQAALQAVRAEAEAVAAAGACQGDAVVLATQTATRRDLLMLDPATGADVPVQVAWLSSLLQRPLVTRPRPCGYWLAADADVAVQTLRALGVLVRQLDRPLPLQAEGWRELSRFTNRPAGPNDAPDGSDSPRLVQVALTPLGMSPQLPFIAPAGSWYVPLDQPLANIAIAALEPDAPSSWFAQRLLPELASAARVTLPP